MLAPWHRSQRALASVLVTTLRHCSASGPQRYLLFFFFLTLTMTIWLSIIVVVLIRDWGWGTENATKYEYTVNLDQKFWFKNFSYTELWKDYGASQLCEFKMKVSSKHKIGKSHLTMFDFLKWKLLWFLFWISALKLFPFSLLPLLCLFPDHLYRVPTR